MKFSIITPTHNRSKKISRAIKSMQAQSYKNWEMIISDDGSTDNTCEVVKLFMEKDKRIKYFRMDKNGGVGKARNYGFKNISPDTNWIGFLDSDDVFVENALELIKNKIKKFPKVKHFSFSSKYQSGKAGCKIKHDNMVGSYKVTLGANDDVSGEFNSVLHKDILDDGFHFNEDVNGYECIAWIALSKKDFKHIYTTTTTRIYITEGESLVRTSNKNKKYYQNVRDGIKIILDEYGDDLERFNRKKFALYLYTLANANIILDNKKLGLIQTIQAIKNDCFNLRSIRNILSYIAK
jgi:glycosyltransferase involved in cell wall biosynthesis